VFETKELASLLAVVNEGTFEAASKRLNITPGAISQRIRQMEERAGHSLLIRSQPVKTTPVGAIVLRLAQQFQRLSRETAQQLGAQAQTDAITLTVAVNHDSHATWFLRALSDFVVQGKANIELRAADQNLTCSMLTDGTAVAAVTTRAEAVPGCNIWRLGSLRYRAVAEPSFAREWFPSLMGSSALLNAPMVCFDRTDALNLRFARRYTNQEPVGFIHHIPASSEMVMAVKLGFGWAMLPDLLIQDALQRSELIDLAPGGFIDAVLYWQVWQLQSGILNSLTENVLRHAASVLR